ncbi:MAG: PAS domain S-box protein [Nitrospirae bacterium]|nr:PAS domain S-box protein [Nitrospirota bacterium]
MTAETIAMLDAMPDGLIIINMQGEILHINAAAARLSGYSTEEVIDERMVELFISEQDKPEFCKTFKNIHADNFIQPFKVMSKRKDRTEFPAIVSFSVIRDSEVSPVKAVAILRDITERNRAEEEKERLQNQLQQSLKMAAIGMLTCGIAHDFSKIVTAINNFSHIGMKQFQASVPQAFDIFANIKAASCRASNLTRQLLTFSRRKPAKSDLIDMNSLINELLQMLSSIISNDIGIKLSLDTDLRMITGDMGKMEQVIMNLIINAGDAMPQGGTLVIKSENVTINTPYHNGMPITRPGSFIMLTVRDTGLGISKDHINYVFEPFFTTRKSRVNAGLGLSVVKDIIEDHKGWINVISEEGKGTTFEVYLPVENMSEDSNLKGDEELILIAEDWTHV